MPQARFAWPCAGLCARRSETNSILWTRGDSNPWPRECDSRALPTELRAHAKRNRQYATTHGTAGQWRPVHILATMAFLFKNKKLPEGVDPARIPPGQTLTAPDRWPLLHFGPVPKTDIATWDLKVFGAVENPISLDYRELRALPSKEVVADIHCVTSWSRLGDKWTGVPIKEILDRVQPKPEAK